MPKKYVIATQNGYIDGEYKTRRAAYKDLVQIVRDSAADCRKANRRCSIVGSVRKGSVQIKVGGRQGYNLWQRFVVNER